MATHFFYFSQRGAKFFGILPYESLVPSRSCPIRDTPGRPRATPCPVRVSLCTLVPGPKLPPLRWPIPPPKAQAASSMQDACRSMAPEPPSRLGHRYAAPCTQPDTVPEPAEKRCGCALRGCAAALCAVASGRRSARTLTMLADAGNAVSNSWCGCAPAWVQWLPRQPSATASRRPERLWRRQASCTRQEISRCEGGDRTAGHDCG